MKPLPKLVRGLPYVFYALALILGGWRFFNEWQSVNEAFRYGDGEGYEMLARSAAVYWAATEAAYHVGTGAFLHVLIAIYDRLKGAAE